MPMLSRPTYLVAVSGGSIYMGYSPNQLTLCTNGEDVLQDTPVMGMQDGPPSPNDTGDIRFHRNMYFSDGATYKRLDAHTGEVFDWEAFQGEGVDGSEIRGLLPFSSDFSEQIKRINSNTVYVDGDFSSQLEVGDEIALLPELASNEGTYSLVSATYNGDTGETALLLDATLTNQATAVGIVARVTGRATIITMYRNRIVLAGLRDEPHAWFMSAVGDPRNWDYSPSTTSVTQAVAGSVSEAGELGDVIVALVPFSDDLMLIGCRDSIWILQGDPADGGVFSNLSQQVGMLGPDAWAFDAANNLYFMSTAGLIKVSSDGSGMVPISAGKLNKTLSRVDLTENRVLLQYDRPRNWVYIFIVKDADDAENDNSYIYDIRTDSFWPIKLPDENGPTSVLFFEAEAEMDRVVLLGGRDGYIRAFRDGRMNDSDGEYDVPIESYVTIGPISVDGHGVRSVISDARFVLGENSGGVAMKLYAEPTPELVAKADTPKVSRVMTNESTRYVRTRVGGQSFLVELGQDTTDTTWALDDGSLVVTATGRSRRVR